MVSVEVGLLSHVEDTVCLHVIVTDTGIGIPEEARARLFDRFEQIDSSTTRRYGGAGLGLAICKKLTERMGGSIGVESTFGEGSQFWFTIEVGNAMPVEMKPETNSGASGARKILMVVPPGESRRTLTKNFEDAGVIVTACANAEDAMDATLIAEASFDAVVTYATLGEFSAKDLHTMLLYQGDGDSVGRFIVLPRGEAEVVSMEAISTEIKDLVVVPQPIDVKRIVGVISGRDRPRAPAVVEQNLDGAPRMRALVVEDNIINQKVIQGMLERLNQEVVIVGDGLEALRFVESDHCDIIFMDMQMPNLDGLETTRRLRGEALIAPEVPIVALTANASVFAAQSCFVAGMQGYITKPVDIPTLQRVLETVASGDSKGLRALASREMLGSEAQILDQRVFEDIADAFSQEQRVELISQLQTSIRDFDTQLSGFTEPESLAVQAHRIKGSSSMLGLFALSSSAKAIELASQSGDREKLSTAISGFRAIYDVTLSRLEGLIVGSAFSSAVVGVS